MTLYLRQLSAGALINQPAYLPLMGFGDVAMNIGIRHEYIYLGHE